MLTSPQLISILRAFPFETATQTQTRELMLSMVRNEIAATKRLRQIADSICPDGCLCCSTAESQAVSARNESRYGAAWLEALLRERFNLTTEQIARPGVPTV